MKIMISVDPSVEEAFAKISRRPQKLSGAIFILENGTNIKVEKEIEKGADFAEFKANFPEDQPRYGVYNLKYTKDES